MIGAAVGLWKPYSGGLMVPARESGDTCRRCDEEKNASVFWLCAATIARPNTAPTGQFCTTRVFGAKILSSFEQAALFKKQSPEHYKFNSTLRNKYAG